MKGILLTVFLIVLSISGRSQSLSRNVITPGGGMLNGGGVALSQTFGQTATIGLSNGWLLTQGFQQPEVTVVVINVRAFLEGLYNSTGLMNTALVNAGISSDATIADSIRIELRNPYFPYSVFASKNTLITRDGHCSISLPPSAFSNSYLLVLKHRNSIEVWSKSPLQMNAEKIAFDITGNAGAIYGDNLKLMNSGVYALYAGDIDQNGSIDLMDVSGLQVMLQNYTTGYYPHDLNGDAITESADYSLLENNLGHLVVKP